MSIADRLIRRLLARSLEPMVREAVAEQLASVVKDPLREPLIYGDATRLHIDPTAVVNNALFNLSSGDITVGRHAFFGHNVAILTGTHDFTTFGRERQIAVPKTVATSASAKSVVGQLRHRGRAMFHRRARRGGRRFAGPRQRRSVHGGRGLASVGTAHRPTPRRRPNQHMTPEG